MRRIFLNKKMVFVFCLLVGVSLGAVLYSNHASYVDIDIVIDESDSDITAKIYTQAAETPELSINPDNLVDETGSTTTLRIKKGEYVLATEEDDAYEKFVRPFEASELTEPIVVSPSYSEQRLRLLLEQEENSIHESIRGSINIPAGYGLDSGELFERGEWYGTTLTVRPDADINNLSDTGTYRVVAYKADSWNVLTLPPEIILNHPDYPDIPRDVLVRTNKLLLYLEDDPNNP